MTMKLHLVGTIGSLIAYTTVASAVDCGPAPTGESTTKVKFAGKAQTNSVINPNNLPVVAPLGAQLPPLIYETASSGDHSPNSLGIAAIKSADGSMKLKCGLRGTITGQHFTSFNPPTIQAQFLSHVVCPDHSQLDFDVATTVVVGAGTCPDDA